MAADLQAPLPSSDCPAGHLGCTLDREDLLDERNQASELLRQVLGDYRDLCDNPESCECSAARSTRYLKARGIIE